MSSVQIFRVEFEVRKASVASTGKADQYRRGVRIATVQAASAHPKDILVPLTNNVTLQPGESIDILTVSQYVAGTDGPGVLQ